MYNSAQKQQYIDFCLTGSKVVNSDKYKDDLENFFERLQNEVEGEFEKDFSMLTYDEMKIALSIFCRRTVNYQSSILSRLRGYLSWSIENGKSLDSENRLDGVSVKDIDTTMSVRMCMISSEEQLKEYLDIVLRPVEGDTIDDMYRVCYSLIYFTGLNLKEVIELKIGDVNFQAMSLTYNGKVFKLPVSLCKLIDKLSEAEQYITVGREEMERKFDINKDGYILERTKPRTLMYTSMVSQISVHFKKLKENLNYSVSITLSDIRMSGIFARAYEIEKGTGTIDLGEYCISEEEDRYSNSTKNDILLAYKTWKRAFEL